MILWKCLFKPGDFEGAKSIKSDENWFSGTYVRNHYVFFRGHKQIQNMQPLLRAPSPQCQSLLPSPQLCSWPYVLHAQTTQTSHASLSLYPLLLFWTEGRICNNHGSLKITIRVLKVKSVTPSSAPVLVVISGSPLVFSMTIITSVGFYWYFAPRQHQ